MAGRALPFVAIPAPSHQLEGSHRKAAPPPSPVLSGHPWGLGETKTVLQESASGRAGRKELRLRRQLRGTES